MTTIKILVVFLIVFTFNYAYAHEDYGYEHVVGSVEIIEMDNSDPRCPMVRRWTLVDGKEYCVIYTHETLHFKLLEVDEYVHGNDQKDL